MSKIYQDGDGQFEEPLPSQAFHSDSMGDIRINSFWGAPNADGKRRDGSWLSRISGGFLQARRNHAIGRAELDSEAIMAKERGQTRLQGQRDMWRSALAVLKHQLAEMVSRVTCSLKQRQLANKNETTGACYSHTATMKHGIEKNDLFSEEEKRELTGLIEANRSETVQRITSDEALRLAGLKTDPND